MPASDACSTTRRTDAMPARCPATRGRPRRAAQRPLPSMMMATCWGRAELCIVKSPCINSALQCKAGWQKKLSARRKQAAHQAGRCRILRALGGIAHNLFERGEIFEIAFAARGGDAANSKRTIAFVALGYFHHAGMLEHAKMPAQIAVCKRA